MQIVVINKQLAIVLQSDFVFFIFPDSVQKLSSNSSSDLNGQKALNFVNFTLMDSPDIYSPTSYSSRSNSKCCASYEAKIEQGPMQAWFYMFFFMNFFGQSNR